MSPIIKQKGERYKIPDKYLLFILTIICVVLIVLSLYTDYLSRPLSAIAGRVIVPMQMGISEVGSYLAGRSAELASVRDLLDENERLRSEIDQLTIENNLYKQDRYELGKLRDLYELDITYADYDKVGARIIARDPGNWFHSFTIDKGSDDGLAVDMNVIAGHGLVGRIARIGPNWSRVVTIVTDNSNVAAQVLATEDHMIVMGNRELYNDGMIEFIGLVDNADRVVIGDKVVTSIISDKYLPGILIGYVTAISRDANNLTKSGRLATAVDFEYLSEVLVITELKEAINENAE